MVRRTSGKSLRRKVASRPERKTIVIFCEGAASEPDYLRGLKCLHEVRSRTAIEIEIDPRHGVPLTLVQMAVDRKADDEVDECWCVFDVEWPQNHPNLKQAVQLAEENGIRVAVSNPCFELWLILHFEDQTAYLSSDDAERKSRHLEGRPGKRIDATRYMPLRQAASNRASVLAQRHARNGTPFPRDNPSSTMSDLLAAIVEGTD